MIKKCQKQHVEINSNFKDSRKKMENQPNLCRKVLCQAENAMVFFIKRLLEI